MKISVITVVFNGERTIEETIKSVIGQSHKDIEYIIIDGKSSDKTLEIVDRYKKRIEVVISEKDKGIYDAMNKGVSFATGDYIFFLNADDTFFNRDVIKNVVEAINKNPEFDYYYGGVVCQNIFGSKSRSILSKSISDSAISWGENIRHQSLFVKREVFDIIGGFNTSYFVNADYDFQCRLVTNKLRGLYMNILISVYDQNGFSSKETWKQYLEKYEIIDRNFGFFKGKIFLIRGISQFLIVETLQVLGLLPLCSRLINTFRGTKI